jgi:hypothetical protein
MRCTVQHGCCKETDRNCLSEPSGSRNKNLLGKIVPPIAEKQTLMISLECSCWLRLVKDSSTGSDELFMELPLVVTSIPTLAI